MPCHLFNSFRWLVALTLLVVLLPTAAHADATLEENLSLHPHSYLARRASIVGDWQQGARVFARAGMACAQCHYPDKDKLPLGPDLAKLADRANAEHIVESILDPSRKVENGYKTYKLLTVDGLALTGIVRQEDDRRIVLVVPGEEKAREILRDDIEQMAPAASLMPKGLVNQLQDEQEFFDLVRFLVKLGHDGPQGEAAEFLATAAQQAVVPLPEYENDLDHRGLIEAWNKQSIQRGQAVYNGLCINCHGTQNAPGSLPNALPFAKGKFKNGSDPYSIYKTITHGYRMMQPQPQLTPGQKYDVIHYIREAYLKRHNPSQYVSVDETYLASLPKGSSRGPAPSQEIPWSDMDYGPFLISTYEMTTQAVPENVQGHDIRNIAYKSIATRLDEGEGGISQGSYWTSFDHDTMRMTGAWSGSGFIDWHGIMFDGRHAIHPRTVGKMLTGVTNVPGWANPKTGSFEDPRIVGKDGVHYGPLPRDWAHYKGLYRYGNRVVISYSIGDADVLESHKIAKAEPGGPTDFIRTLNVGKSSHDLTMRVAPVGQAVVSLHGSNKLEESDGYQVVRIPAADTPLNFDVILSTTGFTSSMVHFDPVEDLSKLTHGGPPLWGKAKDIKIAPMQEDGPFVIDELQRPTSGPWHDRLRLTGLDFMSPTRMVVCTWEGDVWTVDNFASKDVASWRRIASGLFQPLGIKVVNGEIFVGCRNQITKLHDLNGDGEVDFYECFNSDHQVTEHFHEFAMGLQTDAEGNFYYAKSARHALDSLVPHHGTLLKVSADGQTTTILANGFRAANGVCLNPDGSYFVTDQEGHWMPMNRINRVIEGGFYGNMYSYGAPDDTSDEAMEQPLCWPNKEFDRSPAELMWLNDPRWGSLNGSLISTSYGYGRIFVLPHEKVGENWQGGMS